MVLEQAEMFAGTDLGPSGDLVVKPVNRETGIKPCVNWHYLGTLPVMVTDTHGVWENGKFRGVIIYGPPSARHGHKFFECASNEIKELLRIALNGHESPLTMILSRSVPMVKAYTKHLKFIVTFADQGVGHHGGIYQAASWVYLGLTPQYHMWIINGELIHPRNAVRYYGSEAIEHLRQFDPMVKRVVQPPKYKYAIGLTKHARRQLEKSRKPYPKPDEEGRDG